MTTSSTGQADLPKAFVIWAPWAVYDLGGSGLDTGRQELTSHTPVKVAAGRPLFIALPENSNISLDGRRSGAEIESVPFDLGSRRYVLYSLSVGTRDDDATLVVRLSGEVVGVIEVEGHLPRPSWSGGSNSTAPTSRRQERLDLFLLGLVDLIRLVDDPSVAWHQNGWERLLRAWTGAEINLTEPPMALIVRHSATLQRLLNDLGRHPRRILSRTRQMTPIDRVQQLDTASVRWLSRQPGETTYQRAGPKQRILAIQRYEDIDTLENRVLRDLGRRSSELATGYTQRYRRLRESNRWKLVDSYRRDTHRLARNLHLNDVELPNPPIVPNFALLQDRRYRRVWRAYREIIRHADEQDECWRWQHRLWADFCRLVLQVSLRFRNSFQELAESPLRIAQEQQRGRWSQVDAHSGVFLLLDRADQPSAVVSVIWDTSAVHQKLAPWMSGLGATSVLHLQNLHDGSESYILVWALHLFGDDVPELEELAASGQRALDRCLGNIELSENVRIRVEGLVLVSNFDIGEDAARARSIRSGSVVAFRLHAGFGEVSDDIANIGQIVEGIAGRLLKPTDP